MEQLNSTYHLERFFYRNHKKFGAFLMVGSAYNLYFQATYKGAVVTALFSTQRGVEIAGWLGHAAWLTLLPVNLVAAVIGAVVFHRPSLLKGVEALANRWVGDEPLARAADHTRFGIQRTLYRHRRLTSLTIIGGALYTLATLGLYARRLF